jgi:hypothetical protein
MKSSISWSEFYKGGDLRGTHEDWTLFRGEGRVADKAGVRMRPVMFTGEGVVHRDIEGVSSVSLDGFVLLE